MTEEQKNHYFDWAATSPSDEEILKEAFQETIGLWGNPSSLHSLGKEAKQKLEEARTICGKALNLPPEKLYFTSGGTESDHIPILSVLNKPQKGTVLFSSIEHPAVREEIKLLEKCGWKVVSIPANKQGIITPEAVVSKITSDTVLVCIMAVNNETGAIQPIYEIADAITQACQNQRRPKLHVDCVQAAGKIPLNISYKGIDSAAFSAHKICGPRGIGILYLADKMESFLRGGGQEQNIRSGTENLYGAVAFSKCLNKYYISQENTTALNRYNEQKEYTKDCLNKLSQVKCATIIPECRINKEENYSPWVIQASFKNIPGQVMLRALDSEGFYISTGSACSSRKNNRPVLEAMNLSTEIRENAVRFSFGSATTKQAMNELLQKIEEIANRFN